MITKIKSDKSIIVGIIVMFIVACISIPYVAYSLELRSTETTDSEEVFDDVADAVSDKPVDEEEVKAAEEEAAKAAQEAEQANVEAEQVYYEPVYDDYSYDGYYSNGSGLTKSGGVNYYNGRKETWYSSNNLYHYMTPQWTVGSDGAYRDADGYVIVASSDHAYGDVIDTSFGAGKCYDTGCPSGVSDIYVSW